MNNLKRVLSLGLVGAMLSGMMIMGASAATYSDVDEIEHIEAVETMGSLNIINGKDDGTFSPEEFVTRSQMAKMIAVAMNGGKEPNFGVKTNPTFTDVKGHWAETFIEYCYDMKIINGRGDGTFDPDGNVTGTEAAKMVLSALGYDSVAYLLTGPEWDSNVNRNATQVCQPSLYDTVENVVMAQPITRDVAAQIIWNGLQNETREINPDTVVSTGEVTNQYRRSGRTFLEVHYDAKIGYGILINNDKTNTGLTEGHIQLEDFDLDTTSADKLKKSTVDFPWDTDLSLIGEKVKVIFKDGQQGKKDVPDKKDKIYGVYNANETEVVRDIVANVGHVEKEGKYLLKIDGTEYTVATDAKNPNTDTVEVIYNYRTGAATGYKLSELECKKEVKSGDTVTTKAGSKLSQDLKATNGNTLKAVMNDKNEIAKIYVIQTTLEQVTAVSSDKVTITNVGTIKKADNDIYDGVAKDDLVTVTTLYNATPTNEDAFNIVEEAEVITGEVDKFKEKENVTVDGEVYKIYGGADLRTFGGKFIEGIQNKTDDGNRIGKEVELYMVNGYVGAIKLVSEDASNYSVVMAVRSSGKVEDIFDDLKLQVMGADGTKTIISVADDSKLADGKTDVTKATDFTKGDIVTYDINKDGTATVYIKASAQTVDNGATYDKDTKSIVWGSKTYVTAADCVLFVDSGEGAVGTTAEKNSWKPYNIRNLGDVEDTARYAVVLDKDNKVVAVALRAGTPAGAGSAKVYGMVTADNGTYKIDGTTYRQFKISVNGEEYVVNQKRTSYNNAAAATNNGVDNQMKKGRIVGFEPTSDNVYEGVNDFKVVAHGVQQGTAKETPVAVYVKEFTPDEGIITIFEGRTPLDKQGKPVAEGASTVASYEGKGSYTYAVDDDVKMYYVDTDGDTAMESATVSTFNTMTGYKSAYLVLDDNNVVIAIIAEVSGEASVEDGSTVTSPKNF